MPCHDKVTNQLIKYQLKINNPLAHTQELVKLTKVNFTDLQNPMLHKL